MRTSPARGKPLRAEPPDAAEFAGLLRSGRTRLKDASNKGLALESRFGVLAKCHDIRNASEYEGDLQIDERILADLLSARNAVRHKAEALKPPPT